MLQCVNLFCAPRWHPINLCCAPIVGTQLKPISHSAAHMRQWIGSPLVQITACRLFDAKPLSEPKLCYCKFRTLRNNSQWNFKSRELKWSGDWGTGTVGWLSASERGHNLEGCPGWVNPDCGPLDGTQLISTVAPLDGTQLIPTVAPLDGTQLIPTVAPLDGTQLISTVAPLLAHC